MGLFPVLAAAAVSLGDAAQAPAQVSRPDSFGWRLVTPEKTRFDQVGTWDLHFRFKNPRVIVTDVPGRGDQKKVTFYLLYEVINYTGEPRTFIPKLTLKPLRTFTSYNDEVLTTVQQDVAELEGLTDERLRPLNSAELTAEPILPTPQDSAPRAVPGVAIWSQVYDDVPDMNAFSIFVSGLSDGVYQGEDGVIRRKTLQLDFRRLGDSSVPTNEQIEFVENDNPWIYRSANVEAGAVGDGAPAPKIGQ